MTRKWTVDSDGGMSIVMARDAREAERSVRVDLASRQPGTTPGFFEATARPATENDIAWHRAMGGNGGDR